MANWKKVIVSGSNASLNNVTASYFKGDGSALTNIAAASLDIDAFSAFTSLHQTEDHFIVSDNGTEKKITFSNLEDSVFGNVSGDATIAAGGALTLAADSVENSMLANITRGSVKVGGTGNAPTDLDAKTSGQILVGDGTDIASVAVSGDVTLASNGAVTIAADSVENSMLANITRGSVKVGGASNAPTDLVAKTSGQILVGDGTDIASVAVSGDIALASNGAMTIQANSVALATDTTGDYVQNITAGTGLTSTGATSGENIAHTLNVDMSGVSSATIGAGTSEVTIGDNLTINGDLTIYGDTVQQQVSNLLVEDKFILLNSGSAAGDGGIVVQTNASYAGAALVFDDDINRWAVGAEDKLAHNATSVDASAAGFQYIVSVSGSALDPNDGANPNDFGTAAGSRIGMMHVNTATGDIFIYS
tara:strand:- start:4544 stop:5806 length:1263 start_codon:yes stop_codon:yes gene_type:complete